MHFYLLMLRKVLGDEMEHAMVRHEAAEALGAIADPSSLQLLTQHCADPEPIVADSCKVRQPPAALCLICVGLFCTCVTCNGVICQLVTCISCHKGECCMT